ALGPGPRRCSSLTYSRYARSSRLAARAHRRSRCTTHFTIGALVISEAAIVDALRVVRDPSLDRDLVSLKFIKDVAIQDARVSFTIETATAGRSAAKDLLAKQAGEAVAKLPGVTSVDYLIVDLPPGTGGVALSRRGSVPVAGAVLVTTAQGVALADTRRAVRMYEELSVPPLGLLENMSHFVCPTCRTESDIFGKGGGEALAREMNVPFLGRIPIYEPIRIGGDTGVPIAVGEPSSPAAESFRQVAERLASQLAVLAL